MFLDCVFFGNEVSNSLVKFVFDETLKILKTECTFANYKLLKINCKSGAFKNLKRFCCLFDTGVVHSGFFLKIFESFLITDFLSIIKIKPSQFLFLYEIKSVSNQYVCFINLDFKWMTPHCKNEIKSKKISGSEN